jgi:NADP-dependent 3-hydroxy acid dehydrogenase YdfG
VNGINLRGIWASMKHELAQMRSQGSGAIVNCSSLGGLSGYLAGPPTTPPSTGSSV